MKDLKHYKEFLSEMAEELIDAEVTFYPKDVKFSKDGKVSSYKIKTVIAIENKEDEIHDKGLEKALISFMNEAKIKKDLSINPHGIIFTTEVYASTDLKKGIQMYVYLGNKKIPINT